MTNSWNLEVLRKFVRSNKETPQIHIEQINSIARAIEIFRYHKDLAKENIDLIEPTNEREAIELIFTPKEKLQEHWERMLAIQANTQACVHYARSIHDLFAQVANGLVLDDPIPIHDCDIKKLSKKLQGSKLQSHVNTLLASSEFSYVNAFINTIKHRNLVKFGATASFETGECGVQFKGFKYSGKYFEPLWAEQVVKHSLSVKNQVIAIGNVLNSELGVSGM